MVRLGGIFVGLGFVAALLFALVSDVLTYLREPPVSSAAEEFHLHPKEVKFSFDGPLGRFDNQQLQRGFQVYKEVCSACHSLKYVAFRDLEQIGFSEAEVKAIAKNWVVEQPSVDPATGEAATRKSLPNDRFPSPYPNDVAARAANNNALPPDQSLIIKARENGAPYVYSLLTGYTTQEGFKNEKGEELLKKFPEAKTPEGLHFNPYFHSLNIAMAAPLTDGQVSYADGTKASVDQMAKDVTAFLTWAAEPKMGERKATGIWFLVFLFGATGFAYASYRTIWADKKPGKKDTALVS